MIENPLTEKYTGHNTDDILIKESLKGDKASLEKLIKRHQDFIYNIALRMVFNPDEAKDITQEVLIKIITKLSTFEGKSNFRTWAYRIVINHVLNIKKSKGELSHTNSFNTYAVLIDNTPDFDLKDEEYSIDSGLIVEEVKISCMFGMLLCLDREQRMVYILGSIFQVTDKVGAELLDITPENYRKKLSRARRDLYNFMHNKCGLVNENNPCRCHKKTKALVNSGYVKPDKMRFNRNYFFKIEQVAPQKIEELNEYFDEKCNSLFREHPFQKSPGFISSLNEILKDSQFKNIFNLN